MHAERMEGVHITNHEVEEKKLLTNNEDEDLQYYNYIKSLKDYNNRIGKVEKKLDVMESGKYERGSMLQRIFEPLVGSSKLENGVIYFEMLDKDVCHDCDEAKTRKLYELLKKDQLSDTEDGSDDARVVNAREKELQGYIDSDALRDRMENEFMAFLKGEKYDYVKDIRVAYSEDLATPLSAKIISTLPDHVFYDIKAPKESERETFHDNPWNPARRNPNINFFEMRKYDQYLQERSEMKKLNAGISHHRNY